MGPVISQVQFDKIQALIQSGLDEGALAVTGGTGLPEGMAQGYFVRPTVFGKVTPDMRIAREEIFGPVLCILGYDSVDDAVAMANDTVFGLQAFVQSTDLAAARKVAARLRAGRVSLNYPPLDVAVPFGGYRQSGNGREGGRQGLAEYLEVKATLGYAAPL
jgi:aldehyde dehydrogenase (NAD+)